MATYTTPAIIIGRHNFGEADRVMVLLTPERGVVRAVAKGVRRIKSRLAGHMELFCESELTLAEGRNMDTVTSARLVHTPRVTDDYDRMRLAYLFAEMINRLSGADELHSGEFELLHEALEELTQADDVLELWFKLRLLSCLGYHPHLDGCAICGITDSTKVYFFNPAMGGIVDLGCSSPGNLSIRNDHIKLWRLMLTHNVGAVRRVNGVGELASSSLSICNEFYDYTFGKRFRSSEVLT